MITHWLQPPNDNDHHDAAWPPATASHHSGPLSVCLRDLILIDARWGERGQGPRVRHQVWALTSAPLTPDYERRHAGHWYIHHPMHLQVFCSRCAWQMAGPKFGVQMMDSEYCSKTGERLQRCSTAAWRMGAGDLSLLRPCFPSFVCQNRLNRSWFQIAIVIFKSGSDLVGTGLEKVLSLV